MKNFNLSTNSLKNKINSKEISIGTWLTIPHQSVVEIISSANLDWIVIDIEHTSISLETCFNLIGHIQGNGMKALVRVGQNDELIIKRVLDAGADGIIVPLIKNKEDVERIVSYVKYPNIGTRGVGLYRAQKYGTNFHEYRKWLEKNVVIFAQVEHIDAVNNLSDILSNENLDGIIVGPYDLSASLNMPGNFESDEFRSALKIIEETTKNFNKSLGCHVIESNHLGVVNKIKEGYNFIAFSLDFFFLGDKLRDEVKLLNKSIK